MGEEGKSSTPSSAAWRFWRRREETDPVHAPGHRHRGPAPDVPDGKSAVGEAKKNQPWLRRSHSDSQKRRFRR